MAALPGTKNKKQSFPRARRFSYHSLEMLKQSERGFILDGVPHSKLANDEIGRTQPSLNFGIPPYSALKDKSCKNFFQSRGLPKEVKDSLRSENGDKYTIDSVAERYICNSSAIQYLEDRKKIGAGYTWKVYGGHLTIPTSPPMQGYHGEEGYRRNTPDLRTKPSVFDDDEHQAKYKFLRRKRIQSAPAKIQLYRAQSAKLYS